MVDPRSVVALVANTIDALAYERVGVDVELVPASMTETLPRVLLDLPAHELGLSPFDEAMLTNVGMQHAAYAGFEFALRCVAAVLDEPLDDHTVALRAAARAAAATIVASSSRAAVWTDLFPPPFE